MTDTAPWRRFLSRNKVYIRGAFENEYGERYLIYRKMNDGYPGIKLFVTGDELDWQPGLGLIDETGYIWNPDEATILGTILFQFSAAMNNPRICLAGRGIVDVLRKAGANVQADALTCLESALEHADYDEIKQWSDNIRESLGWTQAGERRS